jgi:ketosteroid isomerase-like protein
MSQENVELARQYFEALNRGMDASEHFRHPDIEVFDPPDFPDADRHIGEAAVRKLIDGYRDLGWDGQYRVQEYLGAGDEVVVIWQGRVRTPHGGGFPLEQTLAHVLLFEGGKIRRIRQYLTRAEALDAAGLSE